VIKKVSLPTILGDAKAKKRLAIVAIASVLVLGGSVVGYNLYQQHLIRVENEAIAAAGFDLNEKEVYHQAVAAGFQKKEDFVTAKAEGILTAKEYEEAIKDSKERGFDSIASTKHAKTLGFENFKDLSDAVKIRAKTHDEYVAALEVMKTRGFATTDEYAAVLDKEEADARAAAELALLSDANDLFSKYQNEGAIACKDPVEKLFKGGFEWLDETPAGQFPAYKPDVVSSGVLTLVGDQIVFGKLNPNSKTGPKNVAYSCNYDVVNKTVVAARLEPSKK
jgi:hypothetical protein